MQKWSGKEVKRAGGGAGPSDYLQGNLIALWWGVMASTGAKDWDEPNGGRGALGDEQINKLVVLFQSLPLV